MMSAQWPLVGLNLGTIAKSWSAWCGLAMAFALFGVGIDYQKNGALARNWAKDVKDFPLPGKITKSEKCSSRMADIRESTL